MGNCGLKPKALGDDEAAPAPAPAETKAEEAPAVEEAQPPAEETSRAIEVVTPSDQEATSTAAETKEADEPKVKEPAAAEGVAELPASAPAAVA